MNLRKIESKKIMIKFWFVYFSKIGYDLKQIQTMFPIDNKTNITNFDQINS